MKHKEDRLYNTIILVTITFFLLIVAYPLYFIIIASISDPNLVGGGKVLLYPRGITLEGYKRILEYKPIWTGYRNTVIYTVFYTLLSLFMVLTGGYGLSRKRLPGKNIIMGYLTFTMFFGGGLIPTYLLVRNLGLYNNPLVLIIGGCVSVYNIIIARTFMQSNIPDELYEAAAIDGCSHFRFFATIVVPLSPALIAVMALFHAVGQWNSWFGALIYIRNQEYYPLQLVLRNLLVDTNTFMNALQADSFMEDMSYIIKLAESMKYAVIIVSTLPVMLLYPFLQKYFIKGIMIGSLKG